MIKPEIIYEDKELVVLDKPAGWVVNRAKSVKEETIQDWIKSNVKSQMSKVDNYRNGIVHRLDKETSGVLIVAKTLFAFKNLQTQFKQRRIGKKYTAFVHGKVEPEEGGVNVPVGRLPWNRERFGVLPGGKSAVTYYKVIKYLKDDKNNFYTLLELNPKTGRTHQIRVHLKYLGHPIVADEFYAGRKTSKADRLWCSRLFLHASEITFQHSKSNKSVTLVSDLPNDLQLCLKRFNN
ncbi:hypothetical protein A2Z22_00385 [Candidatus Woesebacteria bacterium RBG_16_34_12]|uniref:Pseudouridine synthase n=1 Tax=Candidatus Woesebacteria bacterium RBG_16_34_12 TaxID=1802480 RepID=A0A1F7X945_9BACT|nr:MAG: hypothetical protein A2Z22_00385 [Candidatus Woesebacteria bacterium RBG_16_34_12]